MGPGLELAVPEIPEGAEAADAASSFDMAARKEEASAPGRGRGEPGELGVAPAGSEFALVLTLRPPWCSE